MRPVNLIPSEERTGARRPMRGGPIAYVIVGALAAAVIGVALLVVTGNQISDSKAEVARLQTEKNSVESRAAELEPFTSFHTLHEQRLATIASLADSRFDWQRVMRELSLVLPSDVSLTTLTGTASPSSGVEGAGGIAMRSSIAGPALEITGCALGQDGVAGFVQALKEIDGVTRVGVQSSALGEGGVSESGASTCQTQDFMAQFQIVVAFDAAPVAEAAEEGEVVPAPAPEGETTTASETEGS